MIELFYNSQIDLESQKGLGLRLHICLHNKQLKYTFFFNLYNCIDYIFIIELFHNSEIDLESLRDVGSVCTHVSIIKINS